MDSTNGATRRGLNTTSSSKLTTMIKFQKPSVTSELANKCRKPLGITEISFQLRI